MSCDKQSGQSNVESVVRQVLAELLLVDAAEIDLSQRLIDDLELHGDDFSFDFVPEIEDRLDVNVPVNAWDDVYTVRDVITTICKSFDAKD